MFGKPRTDRKTALITGAAGAIGRAASNRLAQAGYAIVGVDRNEDGMAALGRDLGDSLVLSVVANVADEEESASYVAQALAVTGRLGIFFNNAGIEGPTANIPDYAIADFDRLMAVNVRGIFLGLQHVIPVMLAQGSGSIVNSASSAGSRGSPGMAAYVASKHAVIGLTRTAAAECGSAGVRVNCVAPGPVAGRMIDAIASKLGNGAQDEIAARIPLGHFADPDHVAAMICFLASDESRYVTGAVLPVDGGRTAI